NCSINRRIDYFYKSTANTGNALTRWPEGTSLYLADLVFTTTTLGKAVPFIIRMETGTINRAIYQVSILHDPLEEAAPSWSNPPAQGSRGVQSRCGGLPGHAERERYQRRSVLDLNEKIGGFDRDATIAATHGRGPFRGARGVPLLERIHQESLHPASLPKCYASWRACLSLSSNIVLSTRASSA